MVSRIFHLTNIVSHSRERDESNRLFSEMSISMDVKPPFILTLCQPLASNPLIDLYKTFILANDLISNTSKVYIICRLSDSNTPSSL